MIIINQLHLALDEPLEALRAQIADRLKLAEDAFSYKIVKESLDARRRETPRFIYQVEVEAPLGEKKVRALHDKNILWRPSEPEAPLSPGETPLSGRPIVVGAGPAGLFCAYTLAEHGYRPLLLEQGQAVPERTAQVDRFWQDGTLDLSSNVQFGEGGAGTFSDGKLTSRSKNPLGHKVNAIFARHGAPQEITYQAKPHIGTDLLKGVIVSMREQIAAWGGEVRFGVTVQALLEQEGAVRGVRTNAGDFYANVVLLAIGHSSRDLFRTLQVQGLAMEAKPFAVGFRIEHPQSLVNSIQHRQYAGHPRLGAASYQLTWHDDLTDRGCYTFCMCPGGQVVASASEEGRVVTNGMSFHARNGKNANAAVVVSVGGKDFADDPRRAIAFQRELEAKAYAAGRSAGEYAAPAENIQSFLEGRGQLNIGRVQPTYDRGVAAADLGALLPQELAETLRAGLRAYERKIAGYTAPEAILTGLETRTSSPVRLKREENFECTQLAGLYPCGEGAGYAGGIMSAAVDGLRVARAIISRYAPAEG